MHPTFPRSLASPATRLSLSAIAVVAMLAAHHAPTAAQSTGGMLIPPIAPNPGAINAAPAGGQASPGPQTGAAPRNGYGEMLKPNVKRSAAQMARPYAPINTAPDDQSQIPEIEMYVGETRVFPAPGVARIAVGNGQIMNAAALDNKEVIVFANGVGTSSLFIWNADGRYQRVKLNIIAGDTTRYSREIASFLASIPNAKAAVIGDKVIVEGDNLNDRDLAKIEELAKRYPQIVNFTNRVGWEQMVLMDVKVVEFPINELRELGLKWSAAGGVAVGGIWSPGNRGNNGNYAISVPSASLPPISSVGNSEYTVLPSGLHILSALNLGINAQLNLLAQNGHATLLAEPQLSARNGSKASFLAGGEYPYTVSTIAGPTVIFKPFGVKLDIQPRVDRNGVIRATIESEVSSIDPSFSTPSGPGISTRRTTTEFNLKSGETMVLSGLLSRKTSTTIDKLPLLGDIPIIGALFRSKRFQNDETELVVFVTPTVVDSRSPGLVDRVEQATERLRQNLGREPFLTNPLQPGHDAAAANRLPPLPPPTPVAAPVPPVPTPVADSPAAVVVEAPPAVVATPLTSTEPIIQPVSSNFDTDRGAALLVVRDGVQLKEQPSASSKTLMPLARGAAVHMTDVAPRRNGQVAWRSVRVGDVRGWVPDRAVEPARLRPVSDTDIVSVPVPGPAPERKATGLEPARAITANLPEAGQTLERRRVSARQLLLRVTPDVNAPQVARLTQGDLVEVLPQRPEGNWVAVQADGKRGWVPAQWLVPTP